MTADLSLGIDFGTTNTVLALAACDGPARLVRFAAPGGELFAFRSALSIQAPPDRRGERDVAAGPWAIDAYADDPHETRFIQSFTTFAASRSFNEPQMLGHRYRLEDLCTHSTPTKPSLPTFVGVGKLESAVAAQPRLRILLLWRPNYRGEDRERGRAGPA